MDYPGLRWFSRPPPHVNMCVAPGNRHLSKIYTRPAPSLRPRDPYRDASLCVVRNNPRAPPQLLMTLNDVKNLFVKQLPNMGASYVTRLVYDFEAESVIVLHNGQVGAAISSRLFPAQGFIEIVFCAVESSLQSRGYGRLAMMYLKHVIQTRGIFDILTCADNDAVGYFKKQGFNAVEIRMDPARWVGYIKDYDLVTLVHCRLHPEINYMTYTEHALGRQLRMLGEKTGMKVAGPIPEFEEDFSALPHAVYNVSLPIPLILRRYAPNLRTEGVKKLLDGYDKNCRIVREKLFRILEGLKADVRNSGIFLRPVTEDIAPDYFDVIGSPMDLFSIENRLRRYVDYYKRPDIFATDVTLMCDNAKQFNPPDSSFYRNAVELYKRFKKLYAEEFPDANK